jgi:hypothetical protein
MQLRWLSLLGLVIALGACDRTTGRLPPGGIAALDGMYDGQGVLTQGRPRCSQRTPMAMTVRNGNVNGEIRPFTDPGGAAQRFEAYIDQEGRVITTARFAGSDVLIEGFFDLDRFEGFAKSNDCTNRITLVKRSG